MTATERRLIAMLPATICEKLAAFTPERDARVTSAHGLSCIEMDDDGYGSYERMCSNEVADILVRIGVCRDARTGAHAPQPETEMTATTRRMTLVEANDMARKFIGTHVADLPESMPSSAKIVGWWNALESHLTSAKRTDRHPEASAIRILAAKWTAFLRHNGFAR